MWLECLYLSNETVLTPSLSFLFIERWGGNSKKKKTQQALTKVSVLQTKLAGEVWKRYWRPAGVGTW